MTRGMRPKRLSIDGADDASGCGRGSSGCGSSCWRMASLPMLPIPRLLREGGKKEGVRRGWEEGDGACATRKQYSKDSATDDPG